MTTHPTPAAQVTDARATLEPWGHATQAYGWALVSKEVHDAVRDKVRADWAVELFTRPQLEAVLAAAQAPQATANEAAPNSLDAFFAAFREVFPADATAIAPAHVATALDGVPTAWVSNCPYCRRDLHIVAATDQGAAAEAASRLTQAPQAVAQPTTQAAEVPTGFVMTAVSGLMPLIEALERADRKGYMPDAIADEWAAFDYRAPEATTTQPQAALDAADAARYRWLRDNMIDYEPPGYNGVREGRHDMRWKTEIRELDAAIDAELAAAGGKGD